ncbi:MAG: hypothetical protein GW855_07750 [Erythrobacter sp.]|nr:hypothetical protein [Erythrobacter sp.]NCQ62431.1 hypothetical protein [Alphaproteobacteria bacterium]
MADFEQGDLILFRDLDGFSAARVLSPGDDRCRSMRWSRGLGRFERRATNIKLDLIARRLPPKTDLTGFFAQIDRLEQTRAVRRMAAHESFQREVTRLARELEQEDA